MSAVVCSRNSHAFMFFQVVPHAHLLPSLVSFRHGNTNLGSEMSWRRLGIASTVVYSGNSHVFMFN